MQTFKELLNKYVLPYNKAIVPLVVLGLIDILSRFGVTKDMTVEQVLTLVVTSGFVWLVPNKS